MEVNEDDSEHDVDEDLDLCTKTVKDFVQHPCFDGFMLFVISFNGMCMAIVGPSPERGSAAEQVNFWTVMIFTPLFTAEMILKMWGLGLWRNKDSYLMNNWCRFDLLCVVSSWVDIGISVVARANGEDSANTNVLVLRLVRGIRVFRILRSFTTFAETQTMVDVMVYVVFASKWVMCVLVGFILCVCTLELNWFGAEMRYKCVRMDDWLSADDADKLRRGVAWDKVTSMPYRLQIPTTFCRMSIRPGGDYMGNKCDETNGMMCVFIDEPPFKKLIGFENIMEAALSVICIIFQQEFDELLLSTMQATTYSSALFFCVVMVFGGFFLLEYFTAILCMAYSEISASDFKKGRPDSQQLLLQIGLAEGEDLGDNDSKDSQDDDSGAPTVVSPVARGDFLPEAHSFRTDVQAQDSNSPFSNRWMFWKKKTRQWSRREPKTKDVLSHLFLNMYLEINVEALERIQKRVQESSAGSSKAVRALRVSADTTSYVFAALIMYPAPASEMYGAQGWHGSCDKGIVSHWELGFTVLSVVELAMHIVLTNELINARQEGYEPELNQSFNHVSGIILGLWFMDSMIKIIAFKGPRHYLHSSLNQLDSTITILQLLGTIGWHHPNLACLRVSRWIAVLTLGHKDFQNLMGKTFGSLHEILFATFMVFLFVCVIALFGQQIFSEAEWLDFPREYFGSFYQSLVSMIELSSNDGLQSMIQQGLSVGSWTVIYLVFAMFQLNLLLYRLMIPYMLRHSEESDLFKIRYQIFFGQVLGSGTLVWENTKQHQLLLPFFQKHQSDDFDEYEAMRQAEGERALAESHGKFALTPRELKAILLKNNEIKQKGDKRIKSAVSAWNFYAGDSLQLEVGVKEYIEDEANFTRMRKFKKIITHVLKFKFYEPIRALMALAACYVFGGSAYWEMPEWSMKSLQLVLLIFFQVECVFKFWITFGVSKRKMRMFIAHWPMHTTEVLAMVGMYHAFFEEYVDFQSWSNLRFFHLVRVMYSFKKIPDVGVAYQRLTSLIRDVFCCLILIVCLVIAFSTLAMPLFGGLFWECDDADAADRVQCSGFSYLSVGNLEDGLFILRGRTWYPAVENFDSFSSALGTSFALFLNNGWSSAIRAAMAGTKGGMQPLHYGVGTMGMAFVVYQALAVVLRQMLIAIVINNLKIASGTGMQTEDQKAWISTQRMCDTKFQAYVASKGSVGNKGLGPFIWLKKFWLFRSFVEFTIVINIITMLCVSYGASTVQEDILQLINLGCLIVYSVESLTMFLSDLHIYFLNAWNIFDLIINVVSVLDLYYWYIGRVQDVEIIALRSARVLRLVKLAGRSQKISILLKFSSNAIRSSIGCYLVWMIGMLIFAIPAGQIFQGVRQSATIDSTTLSNFETYGNSVLYLFRIAVQNNYINVVKDLDSAAEPYCTAANLTRAVDYRRSDCSPDSASVWMFFTVYSALSRLVMIPFIAGSVVYTFFETMDELRSVLTVEEVASFEKEWEKLDPDGTGYIGVWKLSALMERLRFAMHPLWFDREKYPDKHDLFTAMLQDEMEIIRAGLQERMGDSRPEARNSAFALPWWEVDKEKKEGTWIKRSLSEKIFRMKNETNLGCKPGQMRYDSVLKVLTALKRFSQSLVTPPNEYMNKMDHICSEKFCIEQEQLFRGVGNYRRQSVLNKRVAASRTPRETPLQTQIKNEQEEVGEDLKNDTNRESRTGISKQAAQKGQNKEGLQPLTSENLKDFLIEDESWEDPKDFAEMHPQFSIFWLFYSAMRTSCGEETLPPTMKVASGRKRQRKLEDWITQHEARGGDSEQYTNKDSEVTDEGAETSLSRYKSRTTGQGKGGDLEDDAKSVCSELDETKWRVNQGKWSDVDSTVADSPRHPEKDCNQSFYSDRNACGAQAAVAHIFFDASLEELIGEMSDIEMYRGQLGGDIAFSLQVPDDVVDVVSFDRKAVSAVVHMYARHGTLDKFAIDPTKVAEALKRQASDTSSDFRTLQPYVSKVNIEAHVDPTHVNPIILLSSVSAGVGGAVGGVDELFREDLSKPPNFFQLVGSVGRGLFQ